jgi:SAM-dependent methyltransferase
MNVETYAVEAAVQRDHWWFVGRRQLLTGLLHDLGPRPTWRVLEVGTGTGANLPVLKALGVRQVVGCDLSADALQYSRQTSGLAFAQADASSLPFASNSFDVVVAADVIEHVDDDGAALREFARVLKPGGHFVLMVPAFPSLWGPQDIVAHHRRRYRRKGLLGAVAGAGLQFSRCFYFNYLLFLPIWAMRKLLLASGVPVESENSINTVTMNRLLTRLFLADVRTAAKVRPPFGVSLCLIGGKLPL